MSDLNKKKELDMAIIRDIFLSYVAINRRDLTSDPVEMMEIINFIKTARLRARENIDKGGGAPDKL